MMMQRGRKKGERQMDIIIVRNSTNPMGDSGERMTRDRGKGQTQ
jgi:hypothetical protein